MAESTDPILVLPLLAFLTAIACIDLATRRIPNTLTVPAAALAAALQLVAVGPVGALLAVGGLVLGAGMLLPLYVAGGMGAGDVKAMAAAGVFLGPSGAVFAAACTLAVGGVLAVALFAAGATVRARHRAAVRLHAASLSDAEPATNDTGDGTASGFAYGPAIAAGTVIALAWPGGVPFAAGA